MPTNRKALRKVKAARTWDDPVVAEVRAVRERIAAQCDYDIDRIFAHFAALEKKRVKKATPRRRTSRTSEK